jgi:MYXO-CTERM domain-containing protein
LIRLLTRLSLLAFAPAVLLLSTGLAAADGPEVGIDAVGEGNSATEVGAIDGCIEVAIGDEVTVDLYVKDVDDLLAWQMWLQYDPAIVEVASRDVEQFLATADDANVFDASDQTPDSDGRYAILATNLSDSPDGTSGSGVLAHITLNAVGPGIAELDLRAEDIDDNGEIDRGPYMKDVDAEVIGDTNDDTFFDGTLRNAAIAVDADCGEAQVSVSGGEDDSSPLLYIVAGVAAGVVVLGLAAVLLMRRRRPGVPADS